MRIVPDLVFPGLFNVMFIELHFFAFNFCFLPLPMSLLPYLSSPALLFSLSFSLKYGFCGVLAVLARQCELIAGDQRGVNKCFHAAQFFSQGLKI
jgi:hypothetical protein